MAEDAHRTDEEHDDDVEPEDPEIRRAKFVLFAATMSLLVLAIAILLVFFQPDTQVVVTHYPNGYTETETHYVLDAAGQPVEQGRHRRWHPNAKLAEEGRHERGERTGEWRFWNEAGELDLERSGVYRAGERIAPLKPGGP